MFAMDKKMILVTGAAGFIGFHVCKRLLDEGNYVIGVDNLNDYYDVKLKKSRLQILEKYNEFVFRKLDIANESKVFAVFDEYRPEIIINLAAQAGVRYSIENPSAYIKSNIVGFANIIEIAKTAKVKNFVYASSSSVYGANTNMPFSELDSTSHQLSLYAATKKANEVIAHSYSSLFGLPTTGLRFFTVYGPWGRPDMALYKFTKAIIEDEEFFVFNFGNHKRDFTYIDDIVEGIIRIQDNSPSGEIPYSLFNIGNNEPIELSRFIKAIESATGKRALKVMMDMQPGDVERTYADTARLESAVGYKPQTEIEDGIAKFVEWFREYHQLSKTKI